MKSTLLSNFQSVEWEPNAIPLFVPASTSPYVAATGNGQNATYAIVGFAGVMISYAEGHGSNMNISIQPAALIDPTDVFSTPGNTGAPSPAGTQTTTFGTAPSNTFISAKLTK